ncbi:MAG: UDP-N-acetylmuramoyl-tripeptide--D-alanyl-D-alanine ligase [Clostridia bacterium]|nr:UDP-N-acetylmuramoyl-tripeptide--D-alanyl-D-alanine ligase [Clostridia bacterium]
MIQMILLFMALAAGCLLSGRILIHYFQLESYQFPGYFRSLKRNQAKVILPGALMTFLFTLSFLLLYLIFKAFTWPFFIIEIVILVAGGYFIGRRCSEKNAKKALAFTPRIKRLYGVAFVVFTGLPLLLFVLWNTANAGQLLNRLKLALILAFPAFLPLWVALAGLLAWPIEKGISELYFRDAQRILKQRRDLIRIGITGSWGKTSVKFILGTLLEEKYHTLVTPASFNTPMGVTKVIRTKLEPGHRVFVSEMGARHVGDIKEMCRLVRPEIGIITSVGPQHLDTFKTVERVTRTKYELIEALPAEGFAVFADDAGICRELYEKTETEKMISGLDPSKDDVWAEGIRSTGEGSTFLLCTKDLRIPCKTALLGELNIRNILVCACVCLKLGMTGEQIARGIEKIRPVEHRLQLIPNPGGMTVIDDAFNSNIKGAIQAFRVLKEMSGTRILVTPGMVELGAQEAAMNREFGKAAADCCDYALLIGKKRSAAISEGLTENGFPKERIVVLNSLSEATEWLQKNVRAGDTVLFENDLPDNYTE